MSDRARHLIALGRSQEAIAELDKSFDSEDPVQWWVRALALFDLDRIDDALKATASGLSIDPESVLLLDVVARCQVRRGDLVAAEEAALAALRVDPEDADLLALYALIVAKAGQLEKAKKLVAQARRLDPESTSALRVEAAIASSRGDDRETLLRSHTCAQPSSTIRAMPWRRRSRGRISPGGIRSCGRCVPCIASAERECGSQGSCCSCLHG